MTKLETQNTMALTSYSASFIRASTFIRHSSFVIRHFTYSSFYPFVINHFSHALTN